MKKIGLTGGIGSGKSTIASIFKALGIPVYNSDDRAKVIINSNVSARDRVISLLGDEAYNSDGFIDREYVADIVFQNKSILLKLNAIIHPFVKEDFDDWCKVNKSNYIIKEAAILFESKANVGLDKVVFVSASESIRMKRVGDRDGLSEKQIRARMNNQWPDQIKLNRSDFIIYNNADDMILPQVLKIHNSLLVDEC
jgi:dephospho-CoA kinase